MTIIPYDQSRAHQFEEMLVPYFITDLQGDIPEEIIRGKLLHLITDLAEKKIIHIAIALEDDFPIGFSIYQIDTPDSDWCKRPGWGFIREFYIAPNSRGKGFGRSLVHHTEQQLRLLGASQLYLTSDNAVPFWEKCNWQKSGEVCSNGLEILTK